MRGALTMGRAVRTSMRGLKVAMAMVVYHGKGWQVSNEENLNSARVDVKMKVSTKITFFVIPTCRYLADSGHR